MSKRPKFLFKRAEISSREYRDRRHKLLLARLILPRNKFPPCSQNSKNFYMNARMSWTVVNIATSRADFWKQKLLFVLYSNDINFCSSAHTTSHGLISNISKFLFAISHLVTLSLSSFAGIWGVKAEDDP